MEISIVHVIISMLLFFILFFGIGFIVNMLLRMTWVMAIVYPLVVIFIVDEVKFIEYFREPSATFSKVVNNFISLQPADIIILSSGLIGAVLSGITMKTLRKRGYRMF
ncbi:YuiB family protein [Bacillus kwashiorkori]|uniref:YuiB family protein n=1 Tax=Bacillus kwashiorkori TaxID=1522318 RepID=UPI0007863263|nr:YuiB family protein [Bacillus kwashiorkori]